MADHAHDVRLIAGRVNRVLHGFAIHRQRLVVLAPGLGPGIERPIQRVGLNAHQTIANDQFAGHDLAALLAPTAEAGAGLLAQPFGPIVGGFVAAHPAEHGARRDAQHHRQAVASSLPPARIGNRGEAQRQRAHLVSSQHEFGGSRKVQVMALRMGQLRAGIALQGAHKHPLGRVQVGAVAFAGPPVALGQPQLQPVGRALHATMTAPRIDKGFQQQQRMPEARRPVARDPPFEQREHPGANIRPVPVGQNQEAAIVGDEF